MRGEHSAETRKGIRATGSSPHARGTPHGWSDPCWESGIIPACAGNTPPIHGRCHAWRDHPRMRGEHLCCWYWRVYALGSSPHARGTLHQVVVSDSMRGIIPACAGNTAVDRIDRRIGGDHPRMRGEHMVGPWFLFAVRGSSPHARGTRGGAHRSRQGHGIIPACAGNTNIKTKVSAVVRDHPRMRGEHEPWLSVSCR